MTAGCGKGGREQGGREMRGAGNKGNVNREEREASHGRQYHYEDLEDSNRTVVLDTLPCRMF